MKYTFANGSTKQKSLWAEAHTHFINLPLDEVALAVTVEFVPSNSGKLAGHTNYAVTDYVPESGAAQMYVRNDAPGFADLDRGQIEEAGRAGVPWSSTKFYMETSAHELGHALFAQLDESYRKKIAELFGIKYDPVGHDEHSLLWQNRYIEGIAETFKEAFLPQAFRVLPNRTNRKISYALFPKFRRLFREGLEDGSLAKTGEQSPKIEQGSLLYLTSPLRYEFRNAWNATPHAGWIATEDFPPEEFNHQYDDGWLSTPEDERTLILHEAVLAQFGQRNPPTPVIGKARTSWRHLAMFVHRDGIQYHSKYLDSMHRAGVKIPVPFAYGPHLWNVEGKENEPIYRYSEKAGVKGWPPPDQWQNRLGPVPSPPEGETLKEKEEIFKGERQPNMQFWWWVEGMLNLTDMRWMEPGLVIDPGTPGEGPVPEQIESPDLDFWIEVWSHWAESLRLPLTPREMFSAWLIMSQYNEETGKLEEEPETWFGHKWTQGFWFQIRPVWWVGATRGGEPPSDSPVNLLVDDVLYEDQGTVTYEVYGYDEKSPWTSGRFLIRQTPSFVDRFYGSQIEETLPEIYASAEIPQRGPVARLAIRDDAYALAGFILSYKLNDQWEKPNAKGRYYPKLEGRMGMPYLRDFLVQFAKYTGVSSPPIHVPTGTVAGTDAQSGRRGSNRPVSGTFG